MGFTTDRGMGSSQAAVLVFFSAAAGTRRVAGDLAGQRDDIAWLPYFSDEPVVFLDDGDPFLIHEVVDQLEDAFRGNAIRAREVDAHPAHLFRKFEISAGFLPGKVEFRGLPAETDDGYKPVVVENLDDGFPAVAGVFGAVGVKKGVTSAWQVGVAGDDDGSYLALGAEEFPCGHER